MTDSVCTLSVITKIKCLGTFHKLPKFSINISSYHIIQVPTHQFVQIDVKKRPAKAQSLNKRFEFDFNLFVLKIFDVPTSCFCVHTKMELVVMEGKHQHASKMSTTLVIRLVDLMLAHRLATSHGFSGQTSLAFHNNRQVLESRAILLRYERETLYNRNTRRNVDRGLDKPVIRCSVILNLVLM